MAQRERIYFDVLGFVFDTLSHGNPGNKAPTASGYAYHKTESGRFKTGTFSTKITELKPGTKYYYRACAHNPLAGWGYGDELTFTTKEKGIWKKITSPLELDSFEVGFPGIIKFKFKPKQKR